MSIEQVGASPRIPSNDPAGPWAVPGILRRLDECFEQGLSASLTAETLNKEFGSDISRNSVVSRWWRSGLRRGVSRAPIEKQRGERRRKTTTRSVFNFKPLKIEPAPPPVAPNWLGLSFMELTNETCRFPSAGPPYFFCGDPSADHDGDRPYCAFHHTLTHQRPSDDSQI